MLSLHFKWISPPSLLCRVVVSKKLLLPGNFSRNWRTLSLPQSQLWQERLWSITKAPLPRTWTYSLSITDSELSTRTASLPTFFVKKCILQWLSSYIDCKHSRIYVYTNAIEWYICGPDKFVTSHTKINMYNRNVEIPVHPKLLDLKI